MSKKATVKWDKRYQDYLCENSHPDISPCSLLRKHTHLLPSQGLALDLACGLAGNAFHMAKQGLHVHAIDSSQVAINYVNNISKRSGLPVTGIQTDIEKAMLEDHQYDVIVVSYYLDRSLFASIIQRLKQGGLLYYQTWTKEKAQQVGANNPEFLLDRGELLNRCKEMKMDILHYHEEGLIGDLHQGERNQATLIALR